MATDRNKNLIEGKLPPQSIDLEEAVLGAIMLENSLDKVISILTPQSFYKDAHIRIYASILNLNHRSEPIDILTVTQELKKTGELEIIGGAYYITCLTNRVASAMNIEYHARIIQQNFILRELIRISSETISKAYDPSIDCLELLNDAEKRVFDISKNTYKKEAKNSTELSVKVIKKLELIMKRPDGLSGIPSGLQALDKITGGWQDSNLIIIGARPAMGKTALAVTIGSNAAMMFRKPTAIFSLEMSETEVMERIVAGEAQINGDLLKKPKQISEYQWKEINNAIGNISNAPLFIDDTPSLSVYEFKAKARRLYEKFGVRLFIIDYLQLMTTGLEKEKGNREQEIAHISRNLKALAKELDVPVIVLSQLSRASETRGGEKRPILSDLRESGAIEQDADIVILPYRPEYYGITADADGDSTYQIAELIIAKNRNGATDTAITRYIGQYTKFFDMNFMDNVNPNKDVNINKTIESAGHDEWEQTLIPIK